MESSIRGRLLVATPALRDPNFHRTVVLVLEHGEEGALGVVCNRPSATPLGEIVAAWGEESVAPGVVFVGGPVQPDGLIGLARLVVDGDDPDPGLPPGVRWFWPGLATVDLESDPRAAVAAGMLGMRAFAGYAGWGPGQLEGELAEGSWFVVDRGSDDLWTAHPDRLWRDVLRRQPGEVAQFAHAPDDPSVN